MNILFLARPSYDRYSSEIYKKLKAEYIDNLQGFFITSNGKETKFIKTQLNSDNIFETSKYLREHWDEFTVERLSYYEEKYDCKPIWSYILTDRFLVGRDYDYVVRITVGLFSFFEDIYTNQKIDLYYSEAIATLQCYISYLVGKKHGAKYLSQMQVRGKLDSEYHYFISDPFQYDINFDVNYKELIFTEEEKQRANDFLTEFEEKYSIPPGQLRYRTKPKFKASFLLLPLRHIYNRIDKKKTDKYSYMYYESYKIDFEPIKFYFRYQKAKKYYRKADYTKKFIYFPLHFQPEASTLICAPKYENQIVFIDALAKSLPADTLFYVKEHYALLGNRELRFYEELKKYPNIVLIDPWESSRKLIEESEAVITLTGSAGYEAMLLRKPVILGGKIFFDNAPGVVRVDDIYQKYVSIMENWEKPSREDIIQYLCASFRGYCKGNTYAQTFHNLLEDNIDDIVESLYNEMNKLGLIK